MAQTAYESTRDKKLMEDIVKEEEQLRVEQQKMYDEKFSEEDSMIKEHNDSVVKY